MVRIKEGNYIAIFHNRIYPIFEIWKSGENIYKTSDSDVLKAISKEINQT